MVETLTNERLIDLLRHNVPLDQIVEGVIKEQMWEIQWKMQLPTWSKEELDVLSARVNTLVEILNLIYDIQYRKDEYSYGRLKSNG